MTATYKTFEVDLPAISDKTFNIVDFGATSGGKVPCTEAINDAIDTASKQGGGRVLIPNGIWLTGPFLRYLLRVQKISLYQVEVS